MPNNLKIENYTLVECFTSHDNEHSHYFARKHKQTMMVFKINKKDYKILYYNDTKKIYENYDEDTMSMFVSNFFKKKIQKVKEKINEIEDFSDKKKKIAESNYNKLRSVGHCSKVWTFSRSLLLHNTPTNFLEKVLNKNPDCLPIKDGKLINLDTGKVRERTYKDYYDFECNVSYLGDDANLKHARKFMKDICNDDDEYVKYMTRVMGYLLTGRNDSRCFFQLCGEGSNGKGSLFSLLRKMLPHPLCDSINQGAISAEQNKKIGSSATEHLIPLKKSRVVIISELDKNFAFSSSTIKSITGGDPIIMRANYGAQESVEIECRIAIETNHPFKFDIKETSLIDRMIYLPFLRRFVSVVKNKKNEVKSDPEFLKKMKTVYLDELFTLFVREGSVKWYKKLKKNEHHFKDFPEIVKKQFDEYYKDNDIVGRFLEERTKKVKIGKKLEPESDAIFQKFILWCKDNHETIKMTNSMFGKSLISKGFVKKSDNIYKKNKRTTKKYYEGLSLIDDDNTSDTDNISDE